MTIYATIFPESAPLRRRDAQPRTRRATRPRATAGSTSRVSRRPAFLISRRAASPVRDLVRRFPAARILLGPWTQTQADIDRSHAR
jgi:hypothetical protein